MSDLIAKKQEKLKDGFEKVIAQKATEVQKLTAKIEEWQAAIKEAQDRAIKADLEKKELLEEYHEFLETIG